jgi:hypothetical protein
VPTTSRIAILAGLLALLSNLAVIGFIYLRTHDEAVATVHRQVIEQGKVLADVYRSGGNSALDDAIDDTMTYADPQTVIALIGPDRRETKGNLETVRAHLLRRLSDDADPPARPDDAARSGRGHAAAAERPMAGQRPHRR